MATPVVSTGNFPELLWPGLFEIWGESYNDNQLVFPKVYQQETSKQRFEKLQQVAPTGLAKIKSEGSEIFYDNPLHGFPKEFTHVVYALGSQITKEMWSDDLYREMVKIPRWLARSMMHTEETTHAGVLNDSFTSTVDSPDGVSFVNSAHPLLSGTTLSNQPTTMVDLTETSLSQARIDIGKFTDDRDLRINVQGRLLLVPIDLEPTAAKVLNSQYEVDTANNAINPVYNYVPYQSWKYLTDTDAWFIVTDAEEGLMSFERWAAEFDRDNHFDTKNLRFSATKRWSQGYADWRGLYGSSGGTS